jgi:ribose transport system permease protein
MGGAEGDRRSVLARARRWLAPRNIGAIYVLVILVVVFSAMSPHEFAAMATAKLIVNQYSTTLLVGLALLLPLASGLYDLSVGAAAGLAGVSSAWFLANVSANPWLALAVGIGVAIAVGAVNAGVVVGLGIDSFIGTLATGSIVTALATAVSGDSTIARNVNGAFQQDLALANLGGVTLPAFVALGVAIALFVLLEKTVFGRRAYAIGFQTEVARLGGVRVKGIRAVALVVSAVLAGLAGILETAVIGAGSPDTGPAFLLPAFAVAFLGATQFRGGRFNAWGTVVAVLLLGTGNVGLLIVGGPSWSPDVFDGAMLIAAVGLTSVRGIGPLARRRRREQVVPVVAGQPDGDAGAVGALGGVPGVPGLDARPVGAAGRRAEGRDADTALRAGGA